MSTVVIMPGGFHPFHAGHLALYNSAKKAFPGAEVFVAATNDTSTRPFPFAIKEKLAKLAGVDAGHFYQVKSPFRADEITKNFNPEKDRLIFVRSEKDATKPPQPGGVKRDGSPAYLQPLAGQTNLRPFAEHAYMAYLPTVEFGPGMTSATQIREAWPRLNKRRKTALVMSLYPATQQKPALADNIVRMLDTAIGTVSEAVMGGGIQPPPGGATTQPPGIRPPSGGATAQAPGIRPPRPQAQAHAPTEDDWMAPHGDEQNEYRLFRSGNKPAVIVRGSMLQTYQPLLNTGEYPFKKMSCQGENDYIIGQPDEEDRVNKIYMLVQNACSRAENGDFSAYNNSNYHRTLGRLLGYPEDKIAAFIAHYFRDKEDLAQTIYEKKLKEFAPTDGGDNSNEDTLFKFARMWYNGNPQVQDRVAQVLAQSGWEIGELESEEGGAFVVRSDDDDSYQGWSAKELTGMSENQGWAATFTNENMAQMFVGGMKAGYQARENQPVAEKKSKGFRDSELVRAQQFLKQHYPNYQGDPEAALSKWVQRSIKHGEQDDREQNQALQHLQQQVQKLSRQVADLQKSDYIEERRGA